MRRAFRGTILAASAFLAVGASACGSLLPGGYAEGVRVHVHNESRGPVDVTAVVNGEALDLGRIHPDNYPFFDLDMPDGRDQAHLVVTASPQSDGAFRTDTIVVGRGSVVNMTLERLRHRSRWWLR